MGALELKIPPVVVVLVFGALMWAVAAYFPFVPVTIPGKLFVAGIIVLIGIVIASSGIIRFHRAQTTVHPGTPEKASVVVDTGVYRISRNPMRCNWRRQS